MSRKPYNYNAQARRTASSSEKQKLRRAPQSTSAAQSKDELAARRALKKANAEKVARQMQQRKEAEQAQRAQADAAPQGTAQAATSRKKQPAQQAKQGAATKRKDKAAAKRKNATRATEQAARNAHPAKHPNGSVRNAQNPNHAPLYDIDADATQRKEAPPSKKKRKTAKPLTKAAIHRRKVIRKLLAMLVVTVLVVVGMVYSVNLLFRVKSIEIQTPEGEMPADTGIYTEEIILAKLGISLDDHFFSFSAADCVAQLEEGLPLLENIEVLRDYPDTVIVRLSPAQETYTIEIAGGWLVLSEQLHVMDTVTTQPALLQIMGLTPSTYVAGQALAFSQTLEEEWYQEQEPAEDEEPMDDATLQALVIAEIAARSDAQLETICTVIEALTQAELLADISAIEFEGDNGISFLYQDRIAVLLGTTNSLDYKLSLVQYILWNENGDGCAATDTGVLDVSYQSADGTITTTFAQGDVTFPVVDEIITLEDEGETDASAEDEAEEDEIATDTEDAADESGTTQE